MPFWFCDHYAQPDVKQCLLRMVTRRTSSRKFLGLPFANALLTGCPQVPDITFRPPFQLAAVNQIARCGVLRSFMDGSTRAETQYRQGSPLDVVQIGRASVAPSVFLRQWQVQAGGRACETSRCAIPSDWKGRRAPHILQSACHPAPHRVNAMWKVRA